MCTIALADITDVNYHAGSVEGGTRVTLTGSNLDGGMDEESLIVQIGGQA